jgi:hypothetical protein
MNCVKAVRDGKEDKVAREVIRKSSDFPLYLGKKWSYRYTAFTFPSRRSNDFLIELSVVGIEDVEVPAGKFKAYKVKSDSTVLLTPEARLAYGKDTSGVSYYWYSPDAKIFVNRHGNMVISRRTRYARLMSL